MKQKVLSVLMVLVLLMNLLVPAQSVFAEDAPDGMASVMTRAAGLKAEYFLMDRSDLVLEDKKGEKVEGNINYPLGSTPLLSTALREQTGQDTYAGIRWTGKLVVPETANYTFYTFSDNGCKLTINGAVVIDYWRVSWEEEQTSQQVHLEAGTEYEFQFDYMEWTGGKCVTLSWTNDASITGKTIVPESAFFQPDPVPENPEALKTEHNGIQGEYFLLAPNGTTGKQDVPIFGELKSTCVDDSISYNSMEDVLYAQTGVKNAAGVRWTANLVAPQDGYYSFHTYSDNGVELTLDGKKILTWWEKDWDKWQKSTEVYLKADEAHAFKFDYFEWEGGSHVNLYWSFKANQGDAEGEKAQIPNEAFYLPNAFHGIVAERIDTSNAQLNLDTGLSGTMDVIGAGFVTEGAITCEVVTSSGNSLLNKVMLNVKTVEVDKMTVEVPTSLRVGKYRLKISANGTTTKTRGAEGIFAVTSDTVASSDRPEYPNPEWSRKEAFGGNNWLSLNGPWEFEFDGSEVGQTEKWFDGNSTKQFSKEINVPFCWESAYSGVTDTSYRGQAWYKKTVTLNSSDWAGKRILMKFGAVDWKSKLWVNGTEVGAHEGGYTAFEEDITDYVNLDEENVLTVWVEDKSSYGDNSYPALVGKQGWNAPCGYTHTSGIWQSVYLEGRKSTTTIAYAHANPDIDQEQVQFDLKIKGAAGQTIIAVYDFKSTLYDQASDTTKETGSTFQGEQTITTTGSETVTSLAPIAIANQKLWNYNEANLYEGTITLKDAGGAVLDTISTYFGQRKVSTAYYSDSVGAKYIYVNNNPVYLSGLLDQGYWPEGTYTAPSEAALKYDIQQMKNLGFNMIRKHLKVEDPLQYYWADKLGMFVWQDMPHATAMCPGTEGAATPGRICYEYALDEMINKEYNHPCIIAVMLFNETWGLQEAYFNNKQEVKAADGLNTLQWVNAMYDKVKQMNPNILVEDMSPCNMDHIQPSDMNTWHMYPRGYASSKTVVNDMVTKTVVDSTFNYRFGYKNDGDPFLNSEFGGVAAYDGDWDVSWCFKHQTDIQRQYNKLSGFVYTEPYDVEYERNGFMTYDRKEKEFGYDEIAYGGDMSVKDLLQEEYIGLDIDPAKVMLPGAQYSAPVVTMRWSPDVLNGQYTVKWRFDGTDVYGNNITTGLKGSFPIGFKPYTREANTIRFKLPTEECVGTVTVWIEDEKGVKIAKNFANVIVSDNQTLTGNVVLDEDTVVLRAGTDKIPEVKTTGKTTFTYTLPTGYDVNTLNSLRVIAEVSSVKSATATNSENAQTTKGSELPSDITVTVNGIEVDTVHVVDNPRDMRGTLTLPQGLNGGSSAGNYGYLINLNATDSQMTAIKASLSTGNQLIVSYEVKEGAANPNGVRIYGDNTGRYAVNPMVILNPEDMQIANATVQNQIKEIATPDSQNHSVEGNIKGSDAGFLMRYNGTTGYDASLIENGTKVVLSTLAGKVLASKEGLLAGAHMLKVTMFDSHIRVYADNNPLPVIDTYDKGGYTGKIAVKAAGNAEFTNLTVTPETYGKGTIVKTGQANVQFVDHFNTESTFASRYETMGNAIVVTTKNKKLELTADMGDKVIVNNTDAEDMVLEADVAIQSNVADGNVGFVFRGSDFTIGADGAKGYYAGYGIEGGKGFVNLGRMDGGSWKALGKVVLGTEAFGTVHRLKVVAVGSRICVYLDNEVAPRIDVYDSQYSSGGAALRGFRATGSFDNVVISTAPRYQSDFNHKRIDEWQTAGDWSADSGKLEASSTNSVALLGNANWSDYQVSSQITIGKGGIAGMAVRGEMQTETVDGYKVLFNQAGKKVSVVLSQKGKADTVLASKAFDIKADQTYSVTVRAVNSNLYVLIDGKRLIMTNDNKKIQGKIGFIKVAGTATFDNVVVSDKYIYNEDFAEGSLTGWNVVEGNFSVSNNVLTIPEGKGLKMVDGYATWNNYVISAKVKLAAKEKMKSNAGFVFRGSDFSTGVDNLRGYVAGVNYNSDLNDTDGASGVELGDLYYGWRQIKNQKQTMENNKWYALEVKVNQNKIMVSLDGVKCYEVEDATYAYGMFGIRNFQTTAYMKELSVVPYELYGVVEEEIPAMDPPVVTPTDPPVVTPTDPPVVTPTDPPVVTPTDPQVVTPSEPSEVIPVKPPVVIPEKPPVITPVKPTVVEKVTLDKIQKGKTQQVVVAFKKVDDAAGYEISYATNKTFTKGKKSVTVNKNKATITNLKKGAIYYVKVRAYTLDEKGKKVYGKYSSITKVTIKR